MLNTSYKGRGPGPEAIEKGAIPTLLKDVLRIHYFNPAKESIAIFGNPDERSRHSSRGQGLSDEISGECRQGERPGPESARWTGEGRCPGRELVPAALIPEEGALEENLREESVLAGRALFRSLSRLTRFSGGTESRRLALIVLRCGGSIGRRQRPRRLC